MDRLGSLDVPETALDLAQLARDGRLAERNAVDLKRALAAGSGANVELARDLASLAIEGGLLVVGVDEGPPSVLTPLPLLGVKERLAHIARDGIRPPLRVDVREIPASSGASDGFVVVLVPSSPDRPHEADGSYWGRSGSGKVKLRHDEIERLRLARSASSASIEQLLDAWVASDPTEGPTATQAHVFVVAEPVHPVPGMLEAAIGRTWRQWIHGVLVNELTGVGEWSPDVREAWQQALTTDGYALRGGDFNDDGSVKADADEAYLIELRLTVDGGIRIFSGRASDSNRGRRVAIEAVIVGLTARAIQAAAVIGRECDFRGDWDVGLAITNLRGVVSSLVLEAPLFERRAAPYPEDSYRAALRVSAADVGDPLPIAEKVADRLNRVLNERNFDIKRGR